MVEQSTIELMMKKLEYSDGETEETISLSDYSFATGSNVAAAGEDYPGQTLPEDQDHYFEFCSEEWSNSVVSDKCFPAQNIIFCGEVIDPHEPASPINLQPLVSIKETRDGKPAAEYYSFRWDGSHNSTRRKAEMVTMKRGDQKSSKVSIGKMRWFLFLFGGTRRFQTEMALRDLNIRIRRSRRISPSSSLFRLNNDGNGMKPTINDRINTRSQLGLWGLLKSISCGGQQHANSTAKPSFGGCIIPRL